MDLPKCNTTTGGIALVNGCSGPAAPWHSRNCRARGDLPDSGKARCPHTTRSRGRKAEGGTKTEARHEKDVNEQSQTGNHEEDPKSESAEENDKIGFPIEEEIRKREEEIIKCG